MAPVVLRRVYVAPGFTRISRGSAPDGGPGPGPRHYTAQTVGAFLGWQSKRGTGKEASRRVQHALAELEAIEKGQLDPRGGAT